MTEPFHFRRYVNGVEMAEDILIEREATLGAAMQKAVQLCPPAPGKTVLVLSSQARDAAVVAQIVAYLRELGAARLSQVGHVMSGGGKDYDVGRATAYDHAADLIERDYLTTPVEPGQVCHDCGGQGIDTDCAGPTRNCGTCRGTGRTTVEPGERP